VTAKATVQNKTDLKEINTTNVCQCCDRKSWAACAQSFAL